MSELLAHAPDVVVECAGHAAVPQYGPEALRSGKALVVASVGALADQGVLRELKNAAQSGGGQIIIPAGALGGIDALAAASKASVASVRYRGTKPCEAWRGTPAEDQVDLCGLTHATPIFAGDAAQASSTYPKNSNVAATVALAGVGFQNTRVELVADPNGTENIHELDVEADAVSFSLRLNGRPSRENPKTSMLTALSIVRAVENHYQALSI
nr:L-aspartate dehydrogenase-like [Nerophis lumbriciformis]